jgi:hypothetical protein
MAYERAREKNNVLIHIASEMEIKCEIKKKKTFIDHDPILIGTASRTDLIKVK